MGADLLPEVVRWVSAVGAAVGAVVWDYRTRRIPNVLTLPLLALGVGLSAPGTPFLWLASALMVWLWWHGGMGGGDLKLWLGMLWLMGEGQPLWALPGALLLSVAVQILWRLRRREPVFGRLGPGAGRVALYTLLCGLGRLL